MRYIAEQVKVMETFHVLCKKFELIWLLKHLR